jgi:hypothetical protein
VWCGVVWCGVVWCGVVWCGVVWCGVVSCAGLCCAVGLQVDLVPELASQTFQGFVRGGGRGVGTRNYVIVLGLTSMSARYVDGALQPVLSFLLFSLSSPLLSHRVLGFCLRA